MKGISGNPVLDAYQRMAISPVAGTTTVQAPTPVTPTEGRTENAEVSISAKARGLAAGGEGAIDTAKVNELKQRIEAGDFRIDHQLIASRMLERAG
ncbi:MAG TPA: flagellar biosynthesis anti-sigma factor FlgM [Polyangiaceae bacterium]